MTTAKGLVTVWSLLHDGAMPAKKLIAACVLFAVVGGPFGSASRADPFSPPSEGFRSGWSGGGDHRRLKVVEGQSPVSSEGPRRRFIIEIQKSMGRSGERFADEVEKILYDPRSWGGQGRLGMKRVDSGAAAFRVTLAKPAMVDRLCAPLPTNGRYSCFNGYRSVINTRRWRNAAASYNYREHVIAYRRYLINHEVGHALGHGHRACPARGAEAPVMMQQTKGVRPCNRNWWPLGYERGPRPS